MRGVTGNEREMTGPGAGEYIRACLAEGKTLSHCLRDGCGFDAGKVITYLPDDIDESALNRFDIGGIIRRNDDMQEIAPAADLWLAGKIRSFLMAGSSNACVFENALAKPGDPWLSRRRTQTFTFEDEVYHYLRNTDSAEEVVLKTIRDATSYIFIGIMTSSAGTISFRGDGKTLTFAGVDQLAKGTEEVIVSAYDGEAYLIWERQRAERTPILR